MASSSTTSTSCPVGTTAVWWGGVVASAIRRASMSRWGLEVRVRSTPVRMPYLASVSTIRTPSASPWRRPAAEAQTRQTRSIRGRGIRVGLFAEGSGGPPQLPTAEHDDGGIAPGFAHQFVELGGEGGFLLGQI